MAFKGELGGNEWSSHLGKDLLGRRIRVKALGCSELEQLEEQKGGQLQGWSGIRKQDRE